MRGSCDQERERQSCPSPSPRSVEHLPLITVRFQHDTPREGFTRDVHLLESLPIDPPTRRTLPVQWASQGHLPVSAPQPRDAWELSVRETETEPETSKMELEMERINSPIDRETSRLSSPCWGNLLSDGALAATARRSVPQPRCSIRTNLLYIPKEALIHLRSVTIDGGRPLKSWHPTPATARAEKLSRRQEIRGCWWFRLYMQVSVNETQRAKSDNEEQRTEKENRKAKHGNWK